MNKNLALSMKEMLTVVESEALQLGSWNKEQVVITIRKKVGWESGEEFLLVDVSREEVKND